MSKTYKAGRKGNRRQEQTPNLGVQAKGVLEEVDENSEIIKQFKAFSVELDAKHDKHERLVKLSRDITIESKRIIFLLHTIDRESKLEPVLKEAELRIANVISHPFRSIAKELHENDPYQFHRGFTHGVQEFIEAITYYSYLKEKQFKHWSDYEKELIYEVENDSKSNETEPGTTISTGQKVVKAYIFPLDYILGLADLTGELMRKCVTSLGTGNIKDCFLTRDFVREIYTGFLGISFNRNRDISHKLVTLKQSLLKMEAVCYNIHVRGSELPNHMLTNVFEETFEDEGYY